jgi:guanylate kinase
MTDLVRIVVVSGFSGAGKGTVIKRFLENNDKYFFSVSATTRKPRPTEVHGVDYLFLSDEEFDGLEERDELLEHARYADNRYGTPALPVYDCFARGERALLDVEVKGALNVRKKCPDALLVYIVPPSAKELYERLRGRGTENMETIRKRLSRASEEVDYIDEYNCILVNDDVDVCAGQLREVIENPSAAAVYKEKNLGLALSMKDELEKLLDTI